MLYIKHIMPVLELLLIIINVIILFAMNSSPEGIDKNTMLGIKTFFGMSLLYERLDKLRSQISSIRKAGSQKIQPEETLKHDNTRVGLVSV